MIHFLGRFQKPIYFLNLARGPIVDVRSLIRAVEKKQVLGAALDVLENEKMDRLTEEQKEVYNRLFAMDEIIFSPHIGGWTVESLRNINNRILDYVKELL